jgi:nucleoporin NDC1
MSKNADLIGHLACLDFAQLAETSKERRSEFFLISQPGGHPHSWNRLSARCLQTMDDFLGKLNESSQALRANHQVRIR